MITPMSETASYSDQADVNGMETTVIKYLGDNELPVAVIRRRASLPDVTVLLPALNVAVAELPPDRLPAFGRDLAAVQVNVSTRIAALHGGCQPRRAPVIVRPSWQATATAPAPVLAALPLITRGPQRGERWMTKAQFAAWCGVAVATVSEWIYTRRVAVTKRGSLKQSRVLIASGERERLRPPVVNRKKGGDDDA
jgi:energy-converting hydrogenase Eha subunit A